MKKEQIIERIKFAEECAGCLSDPDLRRSAFEVVLSTSLKSSGSEQPIRRFVHAEKEDKPTKAVDETADLGRIANHFKIGLERIESAIKISDGEWSLNITDFGEETDTSKKECRAAVIILAINKILTGEDTMDSIALGEMLKDVQLKTAHTKDNILNNSRVDKKVTIYVKGSRRSAKYTINHLGMRLAKQWLEELV